MVYIVGSSSILEKEVLLEKKAKEAFSFLNQQTSPFIRSVSLVFTDRKRTHSTHNHFVRWTRLTQTAFFPRMLWTWPLRPSSTTAFWKRKEKTAPKLRHGVLVKSLSLKAVFDKGRGGGCENSSGKKAERCTISDRWNFFLLEVIGKVSKFIYFSQFAKLSRAKVVNWNARSLGFRRIFFLVVRNWILISNALFFKARKGKTLKKNCGTFAYF